MIIIITKDSLFVMFYLYIKYPCECIITSMSDCTVVLIRIGLSEDLYVIVHTKVIHTSIKDLYGKLFRMNTLSIWNRLFISVELLWWILTFSTQNKYLYFPELIALEFLGRVFLVYRIKISLLFRTNSPRIWNKKLYYPKLLVLSFYFKLL